MHNILAHSVGGPEFAVTGRNRRDGVI